MNNEQSFFIPSQTPVSPEVKEHRRQFSALLDEAEQLFQAAEIISVEEGEVPLKAEDQQEIRKKVSEAFRYAQHNLAQEDELRVAMDAIRVFETRVFGKTSDANHDPEEVYGALRSRFFEDGNF